MEGVRGERLDAWKVQNFVPKMGKELHCLRNHQNLQGIRGAKYFYSPFWFCLAYFVLLNASHFSLGDGLLFTL